LYGTEKTPTPTPTPISPVCVSKLPSIGTVNIKNANFDTCISAVDTLHLFIVSNGGNETINDAGKNALKLLEIREDLLEVYYKDENRTVRRVNMNVSIHMINNIILQYDNLTSHFFQMNNSIVLIPRSKPLLSKLHELDFLNTFPYSKVCYTPQKLDINSYNFTSTCGVNHKDITIDFSNVSMGIWFTKDDITKTMATCNKFYLIPNCTLQKIETTIAFHEDGNITYARNGQKTSLTIGDYYPLKYGAAVCLPDDISPSFWTWLQTVKEVEDFLSYFGISLSVFCYILTIFLSVAFPAIAGPHGRNVMLGLVCSLLLGDTMFLIGAILKDTPYSKIFELCKVIGIIMHFGLLMALSWSIVIGYDIMTTIITTARVRGNSTQLLKYLSITISTSLIIIILATVFDHLEIIMIGYGENGICAPQSFYGRLYFYIIPTIISFAISFGFFIRVMYKISTENRRVSETLEGSGRRDLDTPLIALKLTLLLGISEAIGFVQIVKSNISEEESKINAVFSILYTLIRSLRGLLIACVYICKRDVFRRCRERRRARANGVMVVQNTPNVIKMTEIRNRKRTTEIPNNENNN